MYKTNTDVRNAIQEAGLFQWQVAEEMGICETKLSRMLRKELPEEDKKEILRVISNLEKKRVEVQHAN